jgi:hypothetical protein
MRDSLRFAVCVGALLAATPAAAQNLLANPEFDDDVDGWTADVAGISGSHDAEDYAGIPGSGSARVVNSRDDIEPGGITQCVTIPEQDGTVPFSATVWVRVADGDSSHAAAVVALWFLANDTCDLNDGLLSGVAPTHGAEIWGRSGAVASIYPAATRSVRFDLRVQKFGDPGGARAALFDHAYLPDPPGSAGALCAACALAALRRRG